MYLCVHSCTLSMLAGNSSDSYVWSTKLAIFKTFSLTDDALGGLAGAAAWPGFRMKSHGSMSWKSASRPPLAKKTCFLATRHTSPTWEAWMGTKALPSGMVAWEQAAEISCAGKAARWPMLVPGSPTWPTKPRQTSSCIPIKAIKPATSVTALTVAAGGSAMPTAGGPNRD